MLQVRCLQSMGDILQYDIKRGDELKKIIKFSDLRCCVNGEHHKIVAACGCFDVFHIGHLKYLQGAKEQGDLLFVGINSDESIFNIKGKWPVFSIKDRMQIIAALECVDYVFSFQENTFEHSLCELQPQVFARGCDKTDLGFPEENTVKNLNIKVVTIGDYKRSSSSVLKQYVREMNVKNLVTKGER